MENDLHSKSLGEVVEDIDPDALLPDLDLPDMLVGVSAPTFQCFEAQALTETLLAKFRDYGMDMTHHSLHAR